MQNILDIKEETEFINILKSICQAYQELSVLRMQEIRGSVLSIRRFLGSLSEVFGDVKSSYALSLINKKGDLSLTDLQKKGEVAVLISENEALYGDLLQKVFAEFKTYITQNNCDLMIIGKKGLQLYEEAKIPKETIYFDLADKKIEVEDIKYIIYSLIQYKKITVFYGKFESVISQISTSSIISDSQIENTKEKIDPNSKREYFLFEPSVEEIVSFFETQVFASLLKQTITESQLARYASRIKAMEETLTRIESKEKRMKILAARELHKIADKKQLNNLSAIYKFKGR